MLDCPNLMAVHLPAGRWLVQAKLTLLADFGNNGTTCALVESDTKIIDDAPYIGAGYGSGRGRQTSEQVELIAVVTIPPDVDSTTVAVRCEEATLDDQMYWDSGKLTALEVKDEAQTD